MHTLTHSFTYSFIRSFICSLIHSTSVWSGFSGTGTGRDPSPHLALKFYSVPLGSWHRKFLLTCSSPAARGQAGSWHSASVGGTLGWGREAIAVPVDTWREVVWPGLQLPGGPCGRAPGRCTLTLPGGQRILWLQIPKPSCLTQNKEECGEGKRRGDGAGLSGQQLDVSAQTQAVPLPSHPHRGRPCPQDGPLWSHKGAGAVGVQPRI